jgi:hypothetical protein
MEPSLCKSLRACLSRERSLSLTRSIAVLLTVLAAAALPNTARADQGGVSFWVPGFFGSLAAVPTTPGWSLTNIFYHTSVAGGGSTEFVIGGNVVAGVKARADLIMSVATFTFEPKIFGGQLAVSMLTAGGNNLTSVSATLTGPNGNVISGQRTDVLSGFGDPIWMGSLKWNQGVDNYLVYLTGNFPVGAYEARRLANLGLGHWSIDGGAGYTYLDQKTGHEFSIVGGLTYNFVNPSVDYQNGIDFHVDWAASKYLSKQLFVGVVGYAYQQLTGDSGSGARLGPFKSRVFGVGPQIGLIMPIGQEYSAYMNFKGYKEFGHENRPEGWNLWLTLSISPAAPESSSSTTTPTSTKRMTMK